MQSFGNLVQPLQEEKEKMIEQEGGEMDMDELKAPISEAVDVGVTTKFRRLRKGLPRN